jgi:hypothetical protein
VANRQQTQTPDFIPDTTPDFIPDTTPDFIPDEEQKPSLWQRVTAGYNPGADEFAQKHPILGPAARFLDQAGGAALSFPSNLYHAATDPLTDEEQQEFQGHTRIPGEVTLERLTGAGSAVRAGRAYVDPQTRPTLKQAMSVAPEALGQGVGNLAAGEAMGAAGGTLKDAVKATPGKVGNLVRQSAIESSGPLYGELKPGVQAVSKVGKWVGLPELSDWMLPERSGGPPGEFSRIPKRLSAAQQEALRGAPSEIPQGKPDPFGGMTSTSQRIGNAELPKVTATTPQQPLPRLVDKIKPSGAPKGEVTTLPAPRDPLPGEKPGNMASVPRGRLLNLARQGRPGAGEQLQNTGKTVLYTTPEYPGRGSSLLDRVRESSEPEIELMDQESVGPRINASGDSDASMESLNQKRNEDAAGVKYYREDPGGGRTELTSHDRKDAKAYRPGERIIRVDNNGTTVLHEKPRTVRSTATRTTRGNRQE